MAFPLVYPGDVRPALGSESWVRRMARSCCVTPNARVLVLGVGDGVQALVLARDLGAHVVVVDASADPLERFRSKLASDVAGRVTVQQHADYASLPFEDGEFAAIFADAVPPLQLQTLASTLRRLLAPKARLCLSYPVRVSRHPNPGVMRFWEQKLEEPLLLPRECLGVLERAGYEPQLIESLDDTLLDDFYRDVERALPSAGAEGGIVREEIALHRSQQGRASASFAVMVGRRKEPGERPPPSRHE